MRKLLCWVMASLALTWAGAVYAQTGPQLSASLANRGLNVAWTGGVAGAGSPFWGDPGGGNPYAFLNQRSRLRRVHNDMAALGGVAGTFITTNYQGVVVNWVMGGSFTDNTNLAILVASGFNGTNGQDGDSISAIQNGSFSSAYALAGDGDAVNGSNGGAAFANSTSQDGAAAAWGGRSWGGVNFGAGNGTAIAAMGQVGTLSMGFAFGGWADGGTPGQAWADGDGRARARGGDNTNAATGVVGGDAVSITTNGAGVGEFAWSLSGQGAAGGFHTSFGPTTGQVGPTQRAGFNPNVAN